MPTSLYTSQSYHKESTQSRINGTRQKDPYECFTKNINKLVNISLLGIRPRVHTHSFNLFFFKQCSLISKQLHSQAPMKAQTPSRKYPSFPFERMKWQQTKLKCKQKVNSCCPYQTFYCIWVWNHFLKHSNSEFLCC